MKIEHPNPGRHRAVRSRVDSWPARLVLWLVGALYAVPLVWMLAVSIKSSAEATSPGIALLPRIGADGGLAWWDPSYWVGLLRQGWGNYADVWRSESADFPTYLRNSTIIALLSVIGMTISSSIAAYGFSRLRWRGRDAVFVLVLATLMIPPAVVIPSLYVLFKQLGWIGTFRPLWVPAWFGGAFSIFLLRQFFMTIPRELDEAARIDGCSHVGILTRIILPLSKPALATVILLQFAGSWNDFLGPLVFLNHQEQYTLSLGLHMYQSQHGGTPWNLVMAASVLVVVPVLILYIFTRRVFVEGVGAGGVKE
jgi:multiple sugar transport system permease protein